MLCSIRKLENQQFFPCQLSAKQMQLTNSGCIESALQIHKGFLENLNQKWKTDNVILFNKQPWDMGIIPHLYFVYSTQLCCGIYLHTL